MRGRKAWFAIEAKSFEITVEEAGKRLKGYIWERSKGFTSWMRFGDLSLRCLLSDLEACEKVHKNGGWSSGWEEEGRKYKMERRSNKAGYFLLCTVRDAGQKSFGITVPEGKGWKGGWRLLSETLRGIGVVPSGGQPEKGFMGRWSRESPQER